MLSEISNPGPGFEYFLRTPSSDWDAVQYHTFWKSSSLGLDKSTLTRSFLKQIQIIKAQGSKAEKENAIRLENQFKVESKKKGRIDDFWLKSLPGLNFNLKENDKISAENVFVSCDLDGVQINGIQFGGSGNNFQKHKQTSVEEVMPTKKGNTKAINEFQPPSKRVKSDEPEQQLTPETSGEISVNKDHDDEPVSNSPLNDEFVKEKDYSDPESDASTEFDSYDNDDDPNYVYSSGSSSCEETKFTKSARKLDSDEEISSANQDQEPESRSPIHDEFIKEISGSSSCEEIKVARSARKLDSGEETSSVSPTKRMRLSEDTTPDGLNESANFDYGLRNYEEGIIVDSELALQETDEESVSASERLFNEDTWKKWTTKSGAVVADLLDKFARKKGHPLRPEVWRIVRCGFKIAKPKWCSNEDYSEIQRYTRRATISSRTETISRLQRQRSLESLGQAIEEIRLLNNIHEIIKDEDVRKLLLEELKITCVMFPPQDSFTSFYIKILSIFHQNVFPECSVMQQSNVSESDYGGYVIHPSLKAVIFGLEKCLHYHIGERILSSVKSCRERCKRITSFEQKADGVFSVRLKKSTIEVAHLEMSGGYGYKDLPRSTWDGCCKLPIGNSYMLEEIGERFRESSAETFSKISVFSVHTYENRIELWRMHVPSRGVLQYERTHKAVVPICFEEERKCIFDFVIVLWDLRSWLLEVVDIIHKLQGEHNDSDTNVSNLSGTLPSYPFTPQKDTQKRYHNYLCR